MKRHLILVLAAGLLPSSCDKGQKSKSNESEEATGDFADAGEDEEADAPQEVAGFFCKTTVQETSPARTLVDCDLSEPKSHFELPTHAAPETIKVQIDGVDVPPAEWAYDALTGILEILKESSGQKVTITYDQSDEPETPTTPPEGFTAGTVVDLTGLDGCKFLIQLATGKRLEPTNLAAEFKKDGLEVTFKFEEQKDIASACMAGKIVTVSEMAEKTK